MAGVVIGIVGQAHAFDITPTFDSSISTDPNAAKIEGTINNAISIFKSIYTSNVDVKIKFQEGGGLGGSSTWLWADTYEGFKSHYAATASDALQNSALSTLPSTNPFLAGNSEKQVLMTTAGARALGYSTGTTPDGYDCTITLNTSICFFRDSVDASKYDLQSVAMHEMDEAMGGGGPS